ncbi:DUF1287 domain-containing protein [Shewanella fidelis]|uniref:DUF1287 domain-containing protein n=1 Tax=Shewanella fidelis TaxID=173509 RepID=A0AAW8NKU5_9GAMM|nr:DUF1287 domain-containing protein [Shewanella fidelis]MDR8522945.1 DUF1287 domain-containing protein [Shewanella fidelis]MDW4811729.1 DUF1287 domain-containing protein [Shewanella fidelis]MDW4815850.1 DUF1287 domain-containing protein [Shewanella fidelis]MDW4819940.1 DUF1287 domain-containing protein [Shewanella fidelis]MDW4824086.1 DUF1287 domain-containing protein [Shewanella fidelis]
MERLGLQLLLLVAMINPVQAEPDTFNSQLVQAAMARTEHKVRYDGSYFQLDYPNGDVPANIGVCTDVIIRSYRQLGVDLQALVHEDIQGNFAQYPSKRIWGLTRPDKNIDHRRVPNLQAFFTRNGQVLTVSHDASDYQAGDIVTWMLPGNLPHIGILVAQQANDTQRPLVVHNIGAGPQLEDVLFEYS